MCICMILSMLRIQDCVSIEKSNSYFVTLNAELIKYYKEQNRDAYIHPIIHPARIVMDLWIHNSKTVNIRRSAPCRSHSALYCPKSDRCKT